MSEVTTATAANDRPTALLVIDMQNAMLGGEPDDQPAPFEAEAVIANTAVMLERARAEGAAVVFVRHVEPAYPPMSPGHPAFEVHAAIAPIPGEAVVDKRACDAFCDTPLAGLLAERGVRHVAVCGLQTEACVDSTSRGAMHRGLTVTLAADAHSTWDSADGLTAAQIIAHHNRALSSIPHPTVGITAKPSAEIAFARAD